jgi:hypothetical protein
MIPAQDQSEQGVSQMGTLSPCPWDFSLSRQNDSLDGGG